MLPAQGASDSSERAPRDRSAAAGLPVLILDPVVPGAVLQAPGGARCSPGQHLGSCASCQHTPGWLSPRDKEVTWV